MAPVHRYYTGHNLRRSYINMPTPKSIKSSGEALLLKKLQHWSPAWILSLVANLLLLQLFVWLVTAEPFSSPKSSPIAVLLIPSAPQRQAPPAEKPHQIPPPKPIERKAIVKKKPPETVKPVKPAKKKAVKVAKKPDPPPKPVEPIIEPPREIVETEQPEQPQQTVAKQVNELTQEQNNESSQPQQQPPSPPVIKAVPLFRLTRMPKRLDYDPEALKRFYPKEERDFGKVATVQAMILVDENGDVVDVHIVKSAGANFDAAAKKALLSKLVTVQPGYIGDKPVASWVPIPITFSLTD